MLNICLILTILKLSLQNLQKEVEMMSRKIDIQRSFIDSPILQIHWCRSDNEEQKVIALTSQGTIYKSDDNGRQWSRLSEMFLRKALLVVGDSDEPIGTVSNIVASPADYNMILFTGQGKVNWISQDCGQSVSVVPQEKYLHNFKWHPTEREWLLASTFQYCPNDQVNCNTRQLMLSRDSGITWQIIGKNVGVYNWVGQPKERILACFDIPHSSKIPKNTQNMQSDQNLYVSDDFFIKTKVLLAYSAKNFQLTRDYIFVQLFENLNKNNNQEATLLVGPSYNEGGGYQLLKVDANTQLTEHSYKVIDDSSRQIFMYVHHTYPPDMLGTIYRSDSYGQIYTLSLDNVASDGSRISFHKVLGLNGIYLANVFEDEKAKAYKEFQADQQYEDKEEKQEKEFDLFKFQQTRITFDNGATWSKLNPPKIDSLGNPIKCNPSNCGLHLHINSYNKRFQSIYSRNNSLGIIIACGSIGKYVSHRLDQVNTYMSRDGGFTWAEIHKGSNIFQISDHGGLIVMASNQEAQTLLHYSWNEGVSWTALQFSANSVEIENIITEPSHTSMKFIIYGSTQVSSNDNQNELVEQGVIITIDMEDLHQRVCEGIDQPGSMESDYEIWSPSGIITADCLFGQKITYIRRKQESQCFNPEQFDRQLSTESCPCSQVDYECTPGFNWNAQYSSCVHYDFNVLYQIPTICSGQYTIPSGYRKIIGNQCEGGLTRPDLVLKCPNKLQLIEVVMAAVVLFALYYIYQNIEKFNTMIRVKKYKQQDIKQKLQNTEINNNQRNQNSEFKTVQLDDNEEGLGYQEYDEDLILRDDNNQKLKQETAKLQQNIDDEEQLI